jgi:hypothetical protein
VGLSLLCTSSPVAEIHERNKLRTILKAMETAGALWATDEPATQTSRGRANPASKAAKSETTDDIDAGDPEGAGPVTPKSKPKASKKIATKTPGSSAKRGRKALDVGGEAATDENATPKKKAKVTPVPVSEEQDDVKVEPKKELENGSDAMELPQGDGQVDGTGEDNEDDDEKNGQSSDEADV